MKIQGANKVDDLGRFERPSLAVDVALLTIRDGALQVVVVEHTLGGNALPGTFLHSGEVLAQAASRALREKAGLPNAEFSQLKTFDAPGRDSRGWVLSVGHSGALRSKRIPGDTLTVPAVRPGPLLFDHAEMVQLAVDKLREQYGRSLDPAGLAGETFTVLELRRVYDAVFGREMVKDTFRRYVIDALEPTGESSKSNGGRPAETFRVAQDATISIS